MGVDGEQLSLATEAGADGGPVLVGSGGRLFAQPSWGDSGEQHKHKTKQK